MAEDTKPTPARKSTGLMSRLFSGVGSLLFWLIMSLVFSIVIEWVGIAWFWPDEREQHVQRVLEQDRHYLNDRLAMGADRITAAIGEYAQSASKWLTQLSEASSELRSEDNTTAQIMPSLSEIYGEYQVYIAAVPYVTQVFVVRIAILVFSLPALSLFALVGMIDGLVERHLRRWGGGRESSHTYNLARKSVFPLFTLATVIYLSLPFSLHPAIVVMPFAVLLGVASRITFERLKKYF